VARERLPVCRLERERFPRRPRQLRTGSSHQVRREAKPARAAIAEPTVVVGGGQEVLGSLVHRLHRPIGSARTDRFWLDTADHASRRGRRDDRDHEDN